MSETTTVFTEEESREYLDVQKVRQDLIKKLTANGVPEQSADKILLATLLDGSDRSTFTRAKLRNDKASADDNKNIIKVVGEALRSINIRNYRPVANDKDRVIPVELQPREFVPGEATIGIEPIPLQQIIND